MGIIGLRKWEQSVILVLILFCTNIGKGLLSVTVRLRYAPSPTGHLHIGGARTALFNYLFAKKHNGTYILRIEDTDQARNKENAEIGFMNGFRWLGMMWDEGPQVGGEFGPYSCMERLDIYHSTSTNCLRADKLITATAPKRNSKQSVKNCRLQVKQPRYMGKCRHLTDDVKAAHEAEGRKKTIRFRVLEDHVYTFNDLIRGEIDFESNGIGDFVIVKSDGIPTYNFAVTVDDALMEITHVLRGEEHLSNTPRQLMLYEAFGWKVPEFAHLPLILNETGKKLSKRDESIVQFIEQYEEMGYPAGSDQQLLALLGWSPGGEQEIFSMDQLIEQFSFDRVYKSGAILDRTSSRG